MTDPTEGGPNESHTGRRAWLLRLVLSGYRRLGADPTEPDGNEGRWPSTRQAFLWDLLPDEPAPRRDGVVKPEWSPPPWVGQVPDADLDEALADERKAHVDEVATVQVIEGKAARLLTPAVTLVTGTVALAAFELKGAADAHTLLGAMIPLLGAIFATFAALWLFAAIVRALDADTRMGVYASPAPELRLNGKRAMLEAEALGTALASWTGRQKVRRLMQARVAISRAVVVLSVALMLGGVTILTRSSDRATLHDPPKCDCAQPSPSSSPPRATTTPKPTPTDSVQSPLPTSSSARP